MVIGVDMSSIVDHAKQIVKDNKLDDVVTIIRCGIRDRMTSTEKHILVMIIRGAE